jgi:hypothetical protein
MRNKNNILEIITIKTTIRIKDLIINKTDSNTMTNIYKNKRDYNMMNIHKKMKYYYYNIIYIDDSI